MGLGELTLLHPVLCLLCGITEAGGLPEVQALEIIFCRSSSWEDFFSEDVGVWDADSTCQVLELRMND